MDNKYWLLLLAAVLITGGYLITSNFLSKSAEKTEPFYFIDATAESGLNSLSQPLLYNENPSYLEVMGGGVAVGDIDNDGFEDIFFAVMETFDPEKLREGRTFKSALFRNQGDGTFINVTNDVGLDNIKGYPMGALFFDFNNNGLQDLYVASYDGGQLFRNEGGYFTDVTESSGLSLEGLCGNTPCMAAAASAADYNKSGYLDIVIVNNVNWYLEDETGYGINSLLPFRYKAQPTFLFRNNGDGTFTNVSEESGITNLDERGIGEDGKGLSSVWTDVNNNGWPDLYIANDVTPNRLYMNNQDGTFREIAIAIGINEIKSSMGVDTADFTYEGNLDLITTNLSGNMLSLFRNNGAFRIEYTTANSGLISSGRGSGWGVLFVDLDLDGYLDLAVANGTLIEELIGERENENMFFRNNGNAMFQDVSEAVVRFPNDMISRGLSIIDVENTGKPDLIISNIDGASPQLLLNKTDNGNNWVRLDMEGTISNRDAVGARVFVERDDGLIMNQMVKAGNSYQSTSSKSLFFGLGKSNIKQVTVHWPSGDVEIFDDLPDSKIIHIKEGSAGTDY